MPENRRNAYMKIKALKEKRNAKLAEMTAITDKAAEGIPTIAS